MVHQIKDMADLQSQLAAAGGKFKVSTVNEKYGWFWIYHSSDAFPFWKLSNLKNLMVIFSTDFLPVMNLIELIIYVFNLDFNEMGIIWISSEL